MSTVFYVKMGGPVKGLQGRHSRERWGVVPQQDDF